jgi:hypothetical protein
MIFNHLRHPISHLFIQGSMKIPQISTLLKIHQWPQASELVVSKTISVKEYSVSYHFLSEI